MKSTVNETFRKFASRASKFVGSSWVFLVALLFILGWLVSHWPDKFTEHALLIVDTFCTIVTFLIVFLIQNTQNRHNRAMQLKLDELIKSEVRARNDLLGLEELTDEELDMLQDDFHQLRQEFVERRAALIKHHISRRQAVKRS